MKNSINRLEAAYMDKRYRLLTHRPPTAALYIYVMEPVLFNLGWPEWINIVTFSLFCLTAVLLLTYTMVNKCSRAWIIIISMFLLIWIGFKAYMAHNLPSISFFS